MDAAERARRSLRGDPVFPDPKRARRLASESELPAGASVKREWSRERDRVRQSSVQEASFAADWVIRWWVDPPLAVIVNAVILIIIGQH
jgi:hypothetical protein